jgi:hypothetical protein
MSLRLPLVCILLPFTGLSQRERVGGVIVALWGEVRVWDVRMTYGFKILDTASAAPESAQFTSNPF